ncbi:MAG: hypothetical protein A3K10_03010 [Bacteroidetes bacterium RIFCSPLOWO2_12_FULL_31_6]|nr:MAG: hypothetical protein A3K10_03010 [Bacteroidetes bacterium RIFCSPLOWO2_12_FULL_31_6]
MKLTILQKSIIKSSLKVKEAELERALSEMSLFQELKEIQTLIAELDGENEETEPLLVVEFKPAKPFHISAYNKLWSSLKKAEFVVKEAGRGLSTREISNAIVLREPTINRTALVSNLSAGLGIKAKEGKVFFRTKTELGENIYSLLEWQVKKEAPNNMELL